MSSDSAWRALRDAALVTAVVTLVSATMRGPLERYVATVVGFVFLGATWLYVWRKDDATVVAHGLSLGGVFLPRSDARGLPTHEALGSLAWALGFAVVCFVPFYFGYPFFNRTSGHGFHMPHLGWDFANEAAGQLLIVALPEEAFYRGVLQTRFDATLPSRPRVRLLGADLGLGVVVTSLVFALGHLATIHEPARLAVFFPSLAFGFLRARTGGIGAPVVFHAMCNLFSEFVARGYAL
jgi:membrane protease YdiL (CAAX protease family)